MKFPDKEIKRITTEMLSKENHDSYDMFRDKVLLTNEKFKELFGSKFLRDRNAAPWKRGIVILTNGDRKILRMFYGGNSFKLTKEQIGLTHGSLNQLGIGNKKDAVYCIDMKPAKPFIGKFMFYWQHPVDQVRISFKGAFYYCAIALIASAVFSLLSNTRLLH